MEPSKDRNASGRVAPVEFDGFRFEGEEVSEGVNGGTDRVRAYNIETGELVWEKKIYDTPIDPSLETDVQWKFITKLEITDGMLVITNEAGETYTIDPKTGEVQ